MPIFMQLRSQTYLTAKRIDDYTSTRISSETIGRMCQSLVEFSVLEEHSKEINPVLSEPMKLGEKNRPPRKAIEEFTFMNSYKSA